MLSLFANPFAMLAGVLLISSPIIIHLINRMRFKRIRWAAMEFLLKSQKRNRRKLIIEQMILLLLRILRGLGAQRELQAVLGGLHSGLFERAFESRSVAAQKIERLDSIDDHATSRGRCRPSRAAR